MPLDVEPQVTDVWEEQPIQVGRSDKKLNGMLTLPRGNGRPPVVLLLPGSGPNNMDEKVGTGGNKPFADLAHGLAEAGIASIRYDKRSYAYPEDMMLADVEGEYLEDADAAVELLLWRKEWTGADFSCWVTVRVACSARRSYAAIRASRVFISFAGTLRHLEDILLEQTKKMLDYADNLSGITEEAAAERVEQPSRRLKHWTRNDQEP